ncbi:substrate-binding domain-containing protein [Pasteurella bettyae]|uniref:Molybdate ABC transporter, periplasmic molybdate-binding family protein n=1 Tax=Pasteurella bettyae CCUG 2042 TaxID=1095749 RepID=I3DAL5_9PAST|nr:substrate-binding domain-containing protein [Pasteurella bettyae]EIJ68758.1 molybdate ABC transporter, periplasmic molybdate-binding family protein [Pasteurella bettyae CCUG 2042]SUB20901.1 molybdate transport system substrate-binding protein [Pasteurella bettyae]
MQNNQITILSAGSFHPALLELIKHWNMPIIKLRTIFGPAGLLRERIEQGENCDLFISADTKQIEQLEAQHKISHSQIIAQNQLCLTLLNKAEYKECSALDLLLNPNLRVGTSTPICDPSGDYSWQLFEKIEQAYPTHGNRLKNHAYQLVGGRNSVKIPQGELASCYLLQHYPIDMFIGYAHYRKQLKHNSAFIIKSLPAEFSIMANYSCGLLNQNAMRFYHYLASSQAQAIIQSQGFMIQTKD